MEMKFTRHVLPQIKNSTEIPSENITEISPLVKEILADFLAGFRYWEANPADSELFDISRYLGEIDPLGLTDSEQQNSSEYLLEAQAITWLFNNQAFSRETFWAIWIYFFTDELSPFKSQDDELLIALFEEISIIFKSRLTEEERRELALQAQTPWLGASIAATKYQFSSEALILKKRRRLRES